VINLGNHRSLGNHPIDRNPGDRVKNPNPGLLLIKSYPALPESVPRARDALSAFATAAGAVGDELEDIRLAASEALTNAVVHAYKGGPGRLHLTAAVAAGELFVLIADDGAGLHAGTQRPGLGVGLALIASICDELTIVKRASGGTELRMRFALQASTSRSRRHSRGSVTSATSPASSSFSTTT
jgi:anti-sigma regulatory factor (Ser/Thr protein kinase)